MMNLANFKAFTKALAKLNNLDEYTASHYASLIGDTPEMDANGRAIVTDEHGKEIARILIDD